MSEAKSIETMPKTAIAYPAGRAALAGESRFGGSLMQHEQAVRANVNYLHQMRGDAREAGSYSALLSGESRFSSAPRGQRGIDDNRILNQMGARDRSYLTFGTALAGPDYPALKSEHPNDRFKFYSSLDLTSPDKVALGNQWFRDVAERARASGISLTTKAFDHAYDSLNLYTWHPATLAGIITDVYPTYAAQGLYNSTRHFFQGSLEGVNPDHVGFVQEPIDGWPAGRGHSHSVRMGILGSAIDDYMEASQGAITSDQFVHAAREAHVQSDEPYLIAA